MKLTEEFKARMLDDWVFDPTISKHGTHDQKSHGNWARGGAATADRATGGYRKALLESARKSRTFRGEIDVSGSKGKGDLFVDDLTPEKAASRSQRNFDRQFDAVAAKAKSGFKDGDEVLEFFDGINKGLNEGILKPDAPTLRQGNSDKFPYTDVANLGQARRQFAAEFLSRLDKGDPIETAAWVHWRMNFTDHFYADGVGRTTEMAVATVLMRHGLPIPKAPSKEQWYAHAAKRARTPDGTGKTYLGDDYDEFVSFYRGLFPDDVSKHGDGSHDDQSHGNWARGGSSSSDLPLPPGETPIPEGTSRMFHVTSPEAAEAIQREGFRIDRARGETYGEPNLNWFSNKTDYWRSEQGVLIEVALPNEWEDDVLNVGGFSGNMAVSQNIGPERIVAVHQPWHSVYRELTSDPQTQQMAREGLYDSVLEDPKYGPAFKRWFAEQGIEKHYPGRHDQKSHGNRGGWSAAEVIERALSGGFTVRDTTGFVPKKGWTVALSKAVERSIDASKITPEFVTKYRQEFADVLKEPGHYLGGWKENGKVYLDVVETIMDRKQAIDAMLDREQEGIYNLETGEYLMATQVSKAVPKDVVLFGSDVSDEEVARYLRSL